MNSKGYLPAPVFCQTPTQSVSNQYVLFDGCYGVRQDTQHSSGVGFSEIGAFDGFTFSGPNLNYTSETSFEKPHQNQSERLILPIEHQILLYYVNFKSSNVPGQKFLFFLHSSLCCSSCTCVCQLASQLIGHFDYCHSSDCVLCGPVWNVINSDSIKPVWETGLILEETPISISPEKLIAGHKDEKICQNDVIIIGDDDDDDDDDPDLKEEPDPNHVILIDDPVWNVINSDSIKQVWEAGLILEETPVSISPEKLIASHKDEKICQNDVIIIGDDDADPGLKEEPDPNHVILIDDDPDDVLVSQSYPNNLDGFPDLKKEMDLNNFIAIDDSDDLFVSENYPNHFEEPGEEIRDRTEVRPEIKCNRKRDRTEVKPEINCNKKLKHSGLYQEAKMQSCADSSTTEQNELQQHDGLFEHPNKTYYETLQKKEVEAFRLKCELSFMEKIIVDYRKALKEINRAFAEYRARCRNPLPEEPLYKDVPGTGGLVLSTMELNKHIAVV